MNNEIIIGCGAPTMFNHLNVYNSAFSPSIVHAQNTGLSRFYQRYLLQKAMSVFKWTMPKEWSKDYFLYCLYCWGFISVINTDKFGVIPQGCSLRGYDVMYRPTHAVISNPLLSGILEPQIGTQCTLFRLQPDYGGVMDLVSFYADMMALTAESVAVNLVNSKLAYVFRAGNKAQAESFKKMFDQIAAGLPAVFVDKTLTNEDNSLNWSEFSNDLKGNYLLSDLLSDMRKIESMFLTEIGIPNANTDKRERLISDEVNANNFEVKSKCELWLEELQKTAKETRNLFGIDIDVTWRESLQTEKMAVLGGENNE